MSRERFLRPLDAAEYLPLPAFARSGLPQFVAIEPIAACSAVCGDLDDDQAPGAAGLIARGAELHQQFLARQLHGGELLEPGPQPLQLPPTDRPLLGYAIAALWPRHRAPPAAATA